MSYQADSREARQGAAGEAAVRQWLKEQGYFVLDAASAGSGAAMIEGLRDDIVIPDILALLRGQSRWVEVKCYGQAVKYNIARQWRHGVNRDNWYAYLEVVRLSGIPGYLCILEREPEPLICLGEMTFLHAERVQEVLEPWKFKSGPQVLFDRLSFQWFNGPGLPGEFLPIAPQSPYTLKHGYAPTIRQLELEFGT